MILVTGCAGFIGYHLCKKLLAQDLQVIGIDNLNDYYDVNLKKARLAQLTHPNFTYLENDIANYEFSKLVPVNKIEYIIHLAAQAGVRYSLTNPFIYGSSNLIGQLNMLELARNSPNLKHFIYASSSSVYGEKDDKPSSLDDDTNHPISLYAATKKSGELMAHSYAHLYNINMTGLRFFTVYGEYGRPDMMPYIFAEKIYNKQKIQVFNFGKSRRSFTYIDDIISGIIGVLNMDLTNKPKYNIYNLGNNNSEELMKFINLLEHEIGEKADIEYLPAQKGDVTNTCADISESIRDFDFSPNTAIEDGIKHFIAWFKQYHNKINAPTL
jgi:UDP-glucuronate 4-epimerase